MKGKPIDPNTNSKKNAAGTETVQMVMSGIIVYTVTPKIRIKIIPYKANDTNRWTLHIPLNITTKYLHNGHHTIAFLQQNKLGCKLCLVASEELYCRARRSSRNICIKLDIAKAILLCVYILVTKEETRARFLRQNVYDMEHTNKCEP